MASTTNVAARVSGPTWTVTDAVAAAVGAAVFAVLAVTHWVPGLALIALLVVAAVAVPTSEHLAGRILRAVPVLSAVTFVTWMSPSPATPHGDLVAGLVGGVFGSWVSRLAREGHLRRLLPRVQPVDVVAVLAVGAVATANLSYMVLARTKQEALNFWSLQWDNSSHSFIDIAMRHNGVLIRRLPLAPDGTKLSFTEYPAAYHATAEAFMTFLMGHAAADVSSELLSFVRVTGFLGVVGAVLAACAVASLPSVRGNQLTASLAAGLAGSVMIAGPGAIGLVDGHYNFPFALAMVMVAMSTVVGMDRIWDVGSVVVLASAVTVAAGSWLPMGAVAGAMAAAIVFPLARGRWAGSRLTVALCAGAVAVGAAVSLVQVRWVLQAVPSTFTDAVGGISRVLAHQFTFAVVVALFVTGLAFCGRAPVRFAAAGAVLLGLLALYLVMAANQYAQFQQVRYYPAKVQSGFVVLTMVFGAMAMALVGASWTQRPIARGRSWTRTLGAVTAGAVAIFAFGLPIAGPITGDDKPPTPGSLRNEVKTRPDFMAAIEAAGRLSADQYAIVAVGQQPGEVLRDSVLAASIRGTYSNGTSAVLVDMLNVGSSTGVGMMPAIASRMKEGKVVVLITRAQEADYRAALPGGPKDSIRVVD